MAHIGKGGYTDPKQIKYLFIDGAHLRKHVERIPNEFFKFALTNFIKSA
jgi:hypothetical protein